MAAPKSTPTPDPAPSIEAALTACSVRQGHLSAVFEALWEILSALPPQGDPKAIRALGHALSLADLGGELAGTLERELTALELAARAEGRA